jgi:hypothetical protein
MDRRELPSYFKTCPECRQLEQLAKNAVLELTLLEVASRLRRSDQSEFERFDSLIIEAREQQRDAQREFWNHASRHSDTSMRFIHLAKLTASRLVDAK